MNDVEFSIFRNENYIDLNMYQCGREKCKPGHIFGPAARNHYLFHYVLEGRGTLMASGVSEMTNTFEISPDRDSCCIPDRFPPISPTPGTPGPTAGSSLTACR